MKIQINQVLDILEQNGKPSIFRILLQPVPPILKHMEQPVPIAQQESPPMVEETLRPEVIIPPQRYELHTVVVLKKWWRTLTCRSCKTDAVGFKLTMDPKIPV
jgi:hypothetical protein